jgi:hypothetical protein
LTFSCSSLPQRHRSDSDSSNSSPLLRSAIFSGKRYGSLPDGSKDAAGLASVPGIRLSRFTLPEFVCDDPFLSNYAAMIARASHVVEGVDGRDAKVGRFPAFFLVATAGLRSSVALASHQWQPLHPLGLIHVRTRAEFYPGSWCEPQPRVLETGAGPPQIECEGHTTPLQKTERGIECSIVLEYFAADSKTPLLRYVETLLSRDPEWLRNRNKARGAQQHVTDAVAPDIVAKLDLVDGNLGRNFARVSGDWNLHHVFNPAARLMGFRSSIAQGLFTAEMVTERLRLAGKLPAWGTPHAIDVEYKLPLCFPERGLVLFEREKGSFRLSSANGKPYLDLTAHKI